MKIALILAAAFLAGCAGSGQLIREGKAHPFTFNSANKTITATVDGEEYAGRYILNNSFGQASGFTGAKFTTMSIVGSASQGRALLTSQTGKALRCEFAVDGMDAIGQCQDDLGRAYDLKTQ